MWMRAAVAPAFETKHDPKLLWEANICSGSVNRSRLTSSEDGRRWNMLLELRNMHDRVNLSVSW